MVRDTTPTDYHGNPRPEKEAEWAEDWDAVMAFLETNAPAHGPVANRPASAPADATYLATDEEVLYRYDDDADEWVDILNNESLANPDGSYLSNTAVVTDGSDLQDAVDNNGVIRIDGTVDITSEPQITIPNDRYIYGFGTYGYQHSGDEMDVIVDDRADASLYIDGNNVRLFGFAVHNPNDDGTGVQVDGYTPNLSHLHIDAGYKGVEFGDTSNADTNTEPRINFCNIWSRTDSPGDGSIGIHVSDFYDAKIYNNILAGYDTGVQVDQNHATISGNHIYAYPASSISTGIRLGGRWIRCVNNRVEDTVTDTGIEIANWHGNLVITNNLIEGQTGMDGIAASTSVATFSHLLIANNYIGVNYDQGPAATAIDLNGAKTELSYIGQNAIEDYTTLGDVVITDEPGAGNPPSTDAHLPGVTVLNRDDDTLWYHTGGSFIQIGG